MKEVDLPWAGEAKLVELFFKGYGGIIDVE